MVKARMARTLLAHALLIILTVAAVAGEKEHYPNGVEGLKSGTLPPPGNYYRMYNYYYTADDITGAGGDKLDAGFDLRVFANVHRLIHVSEKTKILGGNYFADVIIPVVYQDVEVDGLGIKGNELCLGDITIEPFGICWQGGRFDVGAAVAVFAPTGRYDKNKCASPGRDMWTGMATLGVTYYLDEAKTWHAAILNRYEIHSEKKHSRVRQGDDFHFEWGVGKTICTGWDIGVAGYSQWQVTKDSGDDVTWDRSCRDRVFAVGPEVMGFLPAQKMFLSLRYLWEFEARDRPQGQAAVLTLTWLF